MENYYEGIVKTLKTEANNLVNKLGRAECKNDFGNYLGVVKSLKATLELISSYDWHENHSVYRANDKDDMISIWEQNSDGNIRNHECYKLVSKENLANKSPIEDVKNKLNEIDSKLVSIANDSESNNLSDSITSECAQILSCVNKL